MKPERATQRAIRQYLALRGFASVHVVNGTALPGTPEQKARLVAALKEDGLMVGFPDLLVYASGGRVGHIEVKSSTGRQLPSQKAVEAWLGTLGHQYAVCRSVDDAAAALDAWGWA